MSSELVPSHRGVYASALGLCPRMRPSPSAARSRHFRAFFSFARLASSASWSLTNFIIFLPSGVLKYQSWVSRRGG